ncbi:MAG: cell division protein FtsX [Bacteroidetes bacterium 4572_117]|nr:MAG: cell division protein FtsX [Bacteroidetes bacterium 4572_117]
MSNTQDIGKNKLLGSYTSITISISLVIFMLGLIGLLLINAKKLSDYAKENLGFSVILINDKKEMDIIRLQKELDLADYVLETKFISKEEAAKDLRENLGEDFVGFLGFNPLLASIDVKLRADYANTDSIATIETRLKQNPLVKKIHYQKSLVDLVNENVKKISIILFLSSLLFFSISFALINNTIRLSFYSKRFLINTMQLVGATHSFIRKPFVKKSMFFGALGALFAILMMIIVVYFLQSTLEGIILIKDKWVIFILMLVLGIFISGSSSYFAVNRFLRMKTNELFY